VVPLGPNPTPEDEIQALKHQASLLEQTLEQLKRRIAELEQPQVKEN
jgi:phage shock protein A